MEAPEMFAAVKYADTLLECVRVKHIKDFSPKSLIDFTPTAVHLILSNKWTQDKSYLSYYGIVEGLGSSPEEAEKARKLFLKTLLPSLKAEISGILSRLTSGPIEVSDICSSDCGNTADKGEIQTENQRRAQREANFENQTTLISRLRPKNTLNNSSSASQPPQEINKIKKRKEKSDLEKEQEKLRRIQNAAKENAADEWGQTLSAVTQSNNSLQSVDNRRLLTPSNEAPSFTREPENRTLNSSIVKRGLTYPVEPSCSRQPINFTQSQIPIDNRNLQSFEPSQRLENSNRTADPTALINSAHNTMFSKENSRVLSVEGDLQNNPLVECSKCSKINSEIASLKTELFGKMDGIKSDLSKKIDTISQLLAGVLASRVPTTEENGNLRNTDTMLSFGKLVIDEQVDLGSGYKCSSLAWTAMNTCAKITDWCVGILRGTFGEEKSRLYRLSPRYSDLDFFPVSFISIAKEYYKAFIARRTAEEKAMMSSAKQRKEYAKHKQLYDFFVDNETVLIEQLGASLSDRSSSMHKQWRKRSIAAGNILPDRTKKPTTSKNPPTRRRIKKKYKMVTLPKDEEPMPTSPATPGRLSPAQPQTALPVQENRASTLLVQNTAPYMTPGSAEHLGTPPRPSSAPMTSPQSAQRTPAPGTPTGWNTPPQMTPSQLAEPLGTSPSARPHAQNKVPHIAPSPQAQPLRTPTPAVRSTEPLLQQQMMRTSASVPVSISLQRVMNPQPVQQEAAQNPNGPSEFPSAQFQPAEHLGTLPPATPTAQSTAHHMTSSQPAEHLSFSPPAGQRADPLPPQQMLTPSSSVPNPVSLQHGMIPQPVQLVAAQNPSGSNALSSFPSTQLMDATSPQHHYNQTSSPACQRTWSPIPMMAPRLGEQVAAPNPNVPSPVSASHLKQQVFVSPSQQQFHMTQPSADPNSWANMQQLMMTPSQRDPNAVVASPPVHSQPMVRGQEVATDLIPRSVPATISQPVTEQQTSCNVSGTHGAFTPYNNMFNQYNSSSCNGIQGSNTHSSSTSLPYLHHRFPGLSNSENHSNATLCPPSSAYGSSTSIQPSNFYGCSSGNLANSPVSSIVNQNMRDVLSNTSSLNSCSGDSRDVGPQRCASSSSEQSLDRNSTVGSQSPSSSVDLNDEASDSDADVAQGNNAVNKYRPRTKRKVLKSL